MGGVLTCAGRRWVVGGALGSDYDAHSSLLGPSTCTQQGTIPGLPLGRSGTPTGSPGHPRPDAGARTWLGFNYVPILPRLYRTVRQTVTREGSLVPVRPHHLTHAGGATRPAIIHAWDNSCLNQARATVAKQTKE